MKRPASAQGHRDGIRGSDVVTDWKENFRHPWPAAPFDMFNSTLSESTKYLSQDAVKKFNDWKDERKLKLDIKALASDAFRKCANKCKSISAIVKAANPSLNDLDFEDLSDQEQEYIWRNILWL